MELVIVHCIIQLVLHYLLSSMKNIKLACRCRFIKHLAELKDSLLVIADCLSNADEQQFSHAISGSWLKQLEDVAYEADAVLDEFNHELPQRKLKKQNHKKDVKMSLFTSHSSCSCKRLCPKIKCVNKKLKTIQDAVKGFSFDMDLVSHHASPVELVMPAGPGQQSDSFCDESNIVGREDDVSKLVELLIAAPLKDKVSIISIVGMGGIGKTALARKVFHHEEVRAHFAERIWVRVSGKLNVSNFDVVILDSLAKHVRVIATTEAVLEKIQKHLSGKRYLLVLDDVWNEENEIWDDLMSLLSGISSVNGNRVVITTRKESASSAVKALPVHRLKSLSDDECWSIVKSRVLPNADLQANSKRIAKSIAQRCNGSPLAATIVGRLLQGKLTDDWLFILQNQLSNFRPVHDNRVRGMLNLVYDHLASSGYSRSAYCSIFSRGTRIKREQLMMLWMAEEYLQIDQGNGVETLGHRFCNYVLQKFSFQGMKRRKLAKMLRELFFFGLNDCESAIYVTIHGLLQNLLSVSFKEIIVVFGFKEELTTLQNSLLTIQDFISDPEVMQRINDRAFKSWLEWLEAVAFEADLVLFEFSYEHLKRTVNNQIQETDKETSLCPSTSSYLRFQREMARKMKGVNERLEIIYRQAIKFSLRLVDIDRLIEPPSWGF